MCGVCVCVQRACNCNEQCAAYLDIFSPRVVRFFVLFNLFKPLILFFVVIYDNVLCAVCGDIDEPREPSEDTENVWADWLTDEDDI